MDNRPHGSIRLFRFAGVNVYLHWTWFVLAILLYQFRWNTEEAAWHLGTYLSLFAIVLMHEFGHSLACRSVGGKADTIVLWPLGGIAFVQPPHRPGAVLWSIAAGPLVNVLLIPATLALLWSVGTPEEWGRGTMLQNYALDLAAINIILLVFNLLPIYPLDGGQIVQSILWYFVGFARSLQVVAIVGLACGIMGVGLALWYREMWFVILAAFVVWRSWIGMQVSRALIRQEANPPPEPF